MKLEIKRQDFLKAWQTAEKTAISKAITDFVNSIKINVSDNGEVTLEATDLKTTVKCKASGVSVIEPGAALLPVTVLAGMLKKNQCDILMLEVKDSKGTLTSEGSKSRFPVVSLEAFPKVPESSGAETICEITSKELSRIITEGNTASSLPQDFPRYIGSCLMRSSENSLKIAATDGKRLSVSETPCIVNRNEDVLLPSGALKELAKQLAVYDENVRILTDGSIVWFALESVEFSLRKIEANFPDYERILSNEVYTSLHIPCDKFMAAVERIDIIAKTSIAHIMVMDMKPDHQLRITARSPEYGVAGEFLDADISGNPLQIGFNAGYFLEGLKALGPKDIDIEFSSPEGQTRLKRRDDNSFLYMLMPARLAPQDLAGDELDDDNFQEIKPYQEQEPEEYNQPEYEPEDHNEEYHEGDENF